MNSITGFFKAFAFVVVSIVFTEILKLKVNKMVQEVHILNEVTGLSPVTLLKKEIFHRYFQEFC